jgi:hypothetical protein
VALRQNLADGGSVARLYADRLNRFLAKVEEFFGDEGMADRSLFPHIFGLRTPAPLWTAPAFERCLLLALIYPIVTIFLIWVISGHVGPAEAALDFERDLAAWERIAALAGVSVTIFAIFRCTRGESWTRALWGWVALAGTLVCNKFRTFVVDLASTGTTALMIAVGVGFISKKSSKVRLQGCFFTFFLIVMIVFCLFLAYEMNSFSKIWGPPLLFFGLLTLINSPFDWGSLGLTRALLRRGLELGGWWPLLLALIDAVSAAVIVALLSIAMVVGVQAFDRLAVLGGGAAVLPLDKLFAGIGNRETALEPEYWWIYALLLTTLIPSLINLGIGGASLMRGLPGVPSLLLRHLRADKAVRSYERTWIALVLAAQNVGGVILGIVVQALIFWVVTGYIMPWFGLGLLDMARGLVALNLPDQAWHLLGLIP